MASDTEFDESAQSPGGAPKSSKLFLGGLSWETNEEKLKQHFEKYGEVMEVVVMRDRITRTPRGFGFITFKDEESAVTACQESHNIDGRTIDAKPSVPQGEGSKPKSKKIFVGGLTPDTTEGQFKAYFEQFGKVVEAQIMVDHTSGRSRGFGFVTFDSEAAVGKIINEAGPMHQLNGKTVEVKAATPKGSGPQSGRGGGRGGGVGGPGGSRGGGMAGRGGYMDYAPMQGGYGMQPGYGYGMQYGYGMGYNPGYPGMMMGSYGGYGYAGYPASYPQAGTPASSGYNQNMMDPNSRYHPYPSSRGGRTQQ